jgi:hypothetical protein
MTTAKCQIIISYHHPSTEGKTFLADCRDGTWHANIQEVKQYTADGYTKCCPWLATLTGVM